MGCDDAGVVEYGGGINEGPAGQVGGGGGGGGSGLGSSSDIFDSFGRVVDDTTAFISAQPPEVLLIAFVAVLFGLVVLKRAF